MQRSDISAQELIYMASLAGYDVLPGIPDAFRGLTMEQRVERLEQVRASLFKKGAICAEENKITLSAWYDAIIKRCCTCEMCLTVSTLRPGKRAWQWISWKKDGQYQTADAQNGQYCFSLETPEVIRRRVEALPAFSSSGQNGAITVISRALVKAKQLAAAGRKEDAVRLLRQNGAGDKEAAFLAEGLLEQAAFLNLVLLRKHGVETSAEEHTFLGDRQTAYALSQTVENFRTCTRFEERTCDEIQRCISSLTGSFLME